MRIKIKIKGVVQGVGFRPYVYNLAKKLDLKGFVTNTSEGVTIEVEGSKTEEFIETLVKNPPPLAQIHFLQKEILPEADYKSFEILESIDQFGFTHVSEDVSICEDCLRELFDPLDRRYLYPFINCTNCGPRYTITFKIPYDRPNTTMAVFQMCEQCLKEYKDPTNRRFHAQPNACPKCGPEVKLFVKDGKELIQINNPIEEAIKLIKEGKIIAVKGLGGFHLCCDALKGEVVETLRTRKKRSNKPFALMAPTVDSIEKFCFVSEEERQILKSPQRPILLLRKRPQCKLPDGVSPQNPYVGFMLPYTPLHYLLFYFPTRKNHKEPQPHFDALVMTSGNISEEPIITKNEEAFEKLYSVADAFLVHNRDIFMRVDDSVVKEFEKKIYFIRRARGFVPKAIPLKEELPEVLGVGADLKNTFTLIKSNYAIMSQHIGDMENIETLNFFEEVLENLKSVYRVKPIALAHDLHPAYYSTAWAKEYSEKTGMPSLALQHHYCHIASLMAEHSLNELFGVAFDGTGYGLDGKIWGSEFVYCDIKNLKRLAHLDWIALPGGENAIKNCSRIALSLIEETFGEDIELIKRLPLGRILEKEKIDKILKIKKIPQFSPLSSGMGRLFDGIASLLGVCHYNTFEAEAALAVENLVDFNKEFSEKFSYSFALKKVDTLVIDYRPLIKELIEDILNKNAVSEISWKFHNTVVRMIMQVVEILKEELNFKEVGLSGGVFQNGYLLRETVRMLKRLNLKPIIHEKSPANDACISLGQAYIVAKRIKSGI